MENTSVKFMPMELAMVGNEGQASKAKFLGNGDFMEAFIEAMQGEGTGVLTVNGQEGDKLAKMIEDFKAKNGETKADDALVELLATTLMEMFPMGFDSKAIPKETVQIEMVTEKIAKVLNQNEIPVKQFFEGLKEMGISKETIEQLQNAVSGSENAISPNDSTEKKNLVRDFCVKLQDNISAIEQKEQSPVSIFNMMRGISPKAQKVEIKKQNSNTDDKTFVDEKAAFGVVSQEETTEAKSDLPITVEGIEKKDINKQIVMNVEKAVNGQKKTVLMKLSPKSLGEITVRIVKEDGKLNVNLISSMQDTAKLLENSQAELKNAFKAMAENVTVTTNHANSQNDLSQFLNGQRQWQEQQTRQNNLHYFERYQGEESDDEVIAPVLNENSSRLVTMYA